MKERILKVASQALKTNVDENTTQKNCAEWDSLNHLSLIIELEMEFEVSFEPEEIASMKSVSDINEMLKSKLS